MNWLTRTQIQTMRQTIQILIIWAILIFVKICHGQNSDPTASWKISLQSVKVRECFCFGGWQLCYGCMFLAFSNNLSMVVGLTYKKQITCFLDWSSNSGRSKLTYNTFIQCSFGWLSTIFSHANQEFHLWTFLLRCFAFSVDVEIESWSLWRQSNDNILWVNEWLQIGVSSWRS